MNEQSVPHFPGRAPIDAYGNGGFRFAEMSHRGSILCAASGIYAIEGATPDAMALAALERLRGEKELQLVLLLGTGRTQVFPSAETRKAFAEACIGLEAMDTGAAARTYNVLLAEQRAVAAALMAVE